MCGSENYIDLWFSLKGLWNEEGKRNGQSSYTGLCCVGLMGGRGEFDKLK